MATTKRPKSEKWQNKAHSNICGNIFSQGSLTPSLPLNSSPSPRRTAEAASPTSLFVTNTKAREANKKWKHPGFPTRHKKRIANKQRKGNEQRNLRFHKITHQNLRAQEFQGTVHQRHPAAAVQLQGLLFALLPLQKALSSQLEAPGPTKLKLVTLLLFGGTKDKKQEFGRQVYVTVVNDILSYKIDIISLN